MTPHAVVGQRFQEGDEISALLRRQIPIEDLGMHIAAARRRRQWIFADRAAARRVAIAHGSSIAATAVELDDLGERALTAVVEIGRREADIAQRRHLERAVDRDALRQRPEIVGKNGAYREGGYPLAGVDMVVVGPREERISDELAGGGERGAERVDAP